MPKLRTPMIMYVRVPQIVKNQKRGTVPSAAAAFHAVSNPEDTGTTGKEWLILLEISVLFNSF